MKREQLDRLIGKEVELLFMDGSTIKGVLGYTPEFSAKYQWRKAGYYTVRETDFKASHVRKAVKQ